MIRPGRIRKVKEVLLETLIEEFKLEDVENCVFINLDVITPKFWTVTNKKQNKKHSLSAQC